MRMSLWTRVLGLVVLTAVVTGLSACNTTKGAGKDLERGGEKIQDAVDNH